MFEPQTIRTLIDVVLEIIYIFKQIKFSPIHSFIYSVFSEVKKSTTLKRVINVEEAWKSEGSWHKALSSLCLLLEETPYGVDWMYSYVYEFMHVKADTFKLLRRLLRTTTTKLYFAVLKFLKYYTYFLTSRSYVILFSSSRSVE